MRPTTLQVLRFLLLALLAAGLAACGSGAPTPTPALRSQATPDIARPASRFLTPPPAPAPISFPRDAAPHNDLTEWWYYTGHLATPEGKQYGFEFVIFQGERGDLLPQYAAHFAVTDASSSSFHFDERAQPAANFPNGSLPATLTAGDWTVRTKLGEAHIQARMPGYALDLTVRAAKPPVLHNRVGYFEFAPATGSYYYSETRMDASGTLTVDGQPAQVTGQAWMDHQWGNFLLSQGGWDWFSIQLADNREVMLWHTRDAQNRVSYANGTLVAPDGSATPLGDDQFSITATGSWTSPHSGAPYPSGWVVDIPSQGLHLTITPVVKDQELRTPNSTNVTYWEGDVDVAGAAHGQPIQGQGYVELTGYARP